MCCQRYVFCDSVAILTLKKFFMFSDELMDHTTKGVYVLSVSAVIRD